MRLDSPIKEIKGIGPKTEELFHTIGVYTVGDILLYFPRDYERYPELCDVDEVVPEQKNAVYVRVGRTPVVNTQSRLKTAVLDLRGEKEKLRLMWFRAPYIRSVVKAGGYYVFYGRVTEKNGLLYMEQPEVLSLDKYEEIKRTLQPIYALTKGLNSRQIKKAVFAAMEELPLELEYLPEDIRVRNHLSEYNIALQNMHAPQDEQSCITARNRFVFDEFFFFILCMQLMKDNSEALPNCFHFIMPERLDVVEANDIDGNEVQSDEEASDYGNQQPVMSDKEKQQSAILNDVVKKETDSYADDEKLQTQLMDYHERAVAESFSGIGKEHENNDEEDRKKNSGISVNAEKNQGDFIERLISRLPYELTSAQRRVLRQIREDLRGDSVMQRLVQGDVGSGKTVVAFLAMLDCANSGYQSALMAPTDVLARQHAQKLSALLTMLGLDYPVILLTGSLSARERREAYAAIESEKRALIVGTHALIQEKVQYGELALVITDEQHRFGVKQRESFSFKGTHPHILVMSATPIPRTLAIILYGDLDISVIDEVPAKRLPIKNCVVDNHYRQTAYRFMEREIRAGHQIYIICPLVEDSERSEGENVLDYSERLKGVFSSDIHVAALHGRMKPDEKNRIMEDFLANRIQILVSTTVIEVGVDVPNATVMMIENAERFGLAQLHQLRGRVGRGDAQAYCILMQGNGAKKENRRLEILNKSNDGFYIASEDLKLRGPGDFFGIRQSGDFQFRVADVYQDAENMSRASYEVSVLMRDDPELVAPEHRALRERLRVYAGEKFSLLNL